MHGEPRTPSPINGRWGFAFQDLGTASGSLINPHRVNELVRK